MAGAPRPTTPDSNAPPQRGTCASLTCENPWAHGHSPARQALFRSGARAPTVVGRGTCRRPDARRCPSLVFRLPRPRSRHDRNASGRAGPGGVASSTTPLRASPSGAPERGTRHGGGPGARRPGTALASDGCHRPVRCRPPRARTPRARPAPRMPSGPAVVGHRPAPRTAAMRRTSDHDPTVVGAHHGARLRGRRAYARRGSGTRGPAREIWSAALPGRRTRSADTGGGEAFPYCAAARR